MMIDARSYPARSVAEPEKDKVLRGSKDGFVETVVQNSALIRRRIRSEDLRMEMMNAGKASKTDIIVCYMDSRVDQDLLDMVKTRIRNIQVDALTMNQESLAECLYKKHGGIHFRNSSLPNVRIRLRHRFWKETSLFLWIIRPLP